MEIYKILRGPEWDAFTSSGSTRGGPVDIGDGYIHFSTAAQMPVTLAKHFAGEDGLILCACEADALGADLRWEPSRGGALFPHLYRALSMEEVVWHRLIPWRGGRHHLPPELT